MIKINTLLTLGALIAMPMAAPASQQTIILKVDGITCGGCIYQVERSLKRVEGVIAASASMEAREAVVTFDDSVTDISALTKATANAGFPSRLKTQIQ